MSRRSWIGVPLGLLAVLFTVVASLQYPDFWRTGLAAFLSLGSLLLAASCMPADKRSTSFGVLAGCVLAISVPVVLLMPSPPSAKQVAMKGCLSSAKELAAGLLTYASDYDDRLPPSAEWRTLSERPANPLRRCPIGPAPWTNAMNDNAASISLHEIAGTGSFVLVFEANAYGPNAHGGREWVAPRHAGRAMISTADGHAALANPKELQWNLKRSR